jgi:hydrogenase maturation protease
MRRLVIGIGNPDRGDDAAGIEVARRLRSTESSQLVNGSFELMDIWAAADEVIVVDAARSGAPPGTIHSIMADKEPVPVGLLSTSTHSVGVAETVELARSLGRLPSRLLIYGIEVAEVGLGEGLSKEVERAVEQLVEVIDDA